MHLAVSGASVPVVLDAPAPVLVLQDIDWMDWVSSSGSPALLTEDASADSYPGLAAVDHSNPVVQSDLKGWLLWLKKGVGFDVRDPDSQLPLKNYPPLLA